MLILSIQELDKYLSIKLSDKHPFILYILTSHMSIDFILKHLKNLLKVQSKSHLLECELDVNAERNLLNEFFNYCNEVFGLEGLKINHNTPFVHNILEIVEFLSKRNLNINLVMSYKNTLEVNKLYPILAKLRNLREELKSKNFEGIKLNIFIVGLVPINEIIEHCRDKSVSSVVEDRIVFNTFSFNDLIYYDIFPLDNELFLEYFYELTKGCPYLTEKLLEEHNVSSFNSLNDLDTSYLKIINSEAYKDLILNTVEQLPNGLKSFIDELLKLRLLKFRSLNDNLQNLILSGLVRVWKENDFYILSLKNWAIEMILRKSLENVRINEGTKNALNNLIFIPPLFVANTFCFQIINEIEVLLKNFINIYLENIFNKKHIYEHPLKLLPYPSKKNERLKNKFLNYYEYCENQKRKLFKNEDLNLNSSLYNYLYFSDIIEILFNSRIKEFDNKPLINYLDDIFNNPEELQKKLERLKNIRDAVAHSNTIHVKILDEIIQIKKYIYKKLTIDLTR